MNFDKAYEFVYNIESKINEGDSLDFSKSSRISKTYELTKMFLKLGNNEEIPAVLARSIIENAFYYHFFNAAYMVFDNKMYLQLPDMNGDYSYIFPVEDSAECDNLKLSRDYDNESVHLGKYDVYFAYRSKSKVDYIYIVDNVTHRLLNMSTPDEFDNKENFGGTHNTIFDVANFSLVCMKMNQGIA